MSFDIAKLISKLRVRFLLEFKTELRGSGGKGFAKINNGGCGEFSDWLMEELGKLGELGAAPVDGNEIGVLKHGAGEHAWTYWKGRHYDAETPEGVEDWRDLPFFKRNYKAPPRRRNSKATEHERLEASAAFCAHVRRELALYGKSRTA